MEHRRRAPPSPPSDWQRNDTRCTKAAVTDTIVMQQTYSAVCIRCDKKQRVVSCSHDVKRRHVFTCFLYSTYVCPPVFLSAGLRHLNIYVTNFCEILESDRKYICADPARHFGGAKRPLLLPISTLPPYPIPHTIHSNFPLYPSLLPSFPIHNPLPYPSAQITVNSFSRSWQSRPPNIIKIGLRLTEFFNK